jgi:hypothetical protein
MVSIRDIILCTPSLALQSTHRHSLELLVEVLGLLDLLNVVVLLDAAHALDVAVAQDLLELLDAQLRVIGRRVRLDSYANETASEIPSESQSHQSLRAMKRRRTVAHAAEVGVLLLQALADLEALLAKVDLTRDVLLERQERVAL